MAKSMTCSELSSEQIKMLLILDDEVVEKILKGRLRGINDGVSETDILSAWNRIVEKAQKVLKIDLVNPENIDGIKNEIYRLMAKKLDQ